MVGIEHSDSTHGLRFIITEHFHLSFFFCLGKQAKNKLKMVGKPEGNIQDLSESLKIA